MEKFTPEWATQDMDPMPHPRIRFKGVWDMQDLYEFMVNYLRERKYFFYEKSYKHKRPSPFGAERQYVWNAVRDIDDVYKFTVTVFIHTYDAQDIEIKQKDGTVRTYTKGRIFIELGGNIKIYPDSRWMAHPFWANLRFFLNTYILRKKHGWVIWDVLVYREMHKLIWLIRRRLKMEYANYEQDYWTGVHG